MKASDLSRPVSPEVGSTDRWHATGSRNTFSTKSSIPLRRVSNWMHIMQSSPIILLCFASVIWQALHLSSAHIRFTCRALAALDVVTASHPSLHPMAWFGFLGNGEQSKQCEQGWILEAQLGLQVHPCTRRTGCRPLEGAAHKAVLHQSIVPLQ